MRDERQAHFEKQSKELDRAAREWIPLLSFLTLWALAPRKRKATPPKIPTRKGFALFGQAAALFGASIAGAVLLGDSIPVDARNAVLGLFGAVFIGALGFMLATGEER